MKEIFRKQKYQKKLQLNRSFGVYIFIEIAV